MLTWGGTIAVPVDVASSGASALRVSSSAVSAASLPSPACKQAVHDVMCTVIFSAIQLRGVHRGQMVMTTTLLRKEHDVDF